MTEATQSLLPVTQADRDAAAQAYHAIAKGYMQVIGCAMEAGAADEKALVQLFARHRISHSLPGDVGHLREEFFSSTFSTGDSVLDVTAKLTLLACLGPSATNARAAILGETHVGAGSVSVKQALQAMRLLAHKVADRFAPAALTPSPCPGDAGEDRARKIARDVCDRRNLKRDDGLVYSAALEAAKEALCLSPTHEGGAQ